MENISPFSLKEALSDFSWAYLICQHHSSYVSGPLLSKIMVTCWTPVLQCLNSWSDNRGDWATIGWGTSTAWRHRKKVWATLWVEMSRTPEILSRYSEWCSTQFKTYELLIPGIFHFIFPDCGWPQITETTESETVNKGDTTVSMNETLSRQCPNFLAAPS